ncbi:MAG: hypothetical protein ACJA2Q_001939 [Pseudohongiellaceae bacterium]
MKGSCVAAVVYSLLLVTLPSGLAQVESSCRRYLNRIGCFTFTPTAVVENASSSNLSLTGICVLGKTLNKP